MSMLVAAFLLIGEDLPLRLADPAPQEAGAPVKEEIFAAEVYVLRTQFDEGLSLEDAWGLGADFNFRWKWNGKTRFGFTVGAAFWDSETDLGIPSEEDVDIARYRAGVGFEFPFSKVELGVGALIGAYRFRADGDRDSSPFLELKGSLGFRPLPAWKLGGFVESTHLQSGFNRSHTHLFHNTSAGLMAEFAF